jgi:diguanylate cyclase (GGDEF)-like protein
MRALTKEQSSSSSHPAAARRGWGVFTPQAVEDEGRDHFESGGLIDIRTALCQAEAVIRAQEERIRSLEGMALTDELTGLANRRGFSIAFKRELAMARRDADYDGVLVMIDLDGFKAINDTWGHQTGDAYLCAAADVLSQGVRANDTVARLGGDEFALLLTHMEEPFGARWLTRFEKAFGKKAVLSERLPLRASFGFAAYTGTSSADAVMQTADFNLYAHKAHNKNRPPA